jgi:hypothetical protein
MQAAARGMEKVTSPLVGAKTTMLAKLLWENRQSIDVPSKAAALLGMTVALAPARSIEWALSSRAIERHQLSAPPFFVVGHARSGTTHLFRLLAKDPQFGFLRWRQSIFPHMCGPMRPLADFLLTGLGPSERPMDSMPFSPDEPEEEEVAVGSISGHMANLFMYFPRDARHHFDRWTLMNDLSPTELAEWQAALRGTFKKASWLAGGKRLVSKNPWNTARLPQLHEMWPEAPFLHIVRHPYGVYLSAWNALKTGAPLLQFGHADEEEVRDLFFEFYRELLQHHIKQRAELPTGLYAEVRYEDLVADPVGQLRNVYETLGLEGWAHYEPNLREYLASIADYKPNKFTLDRNLADRIVDEWSFAFEQWGYDADVLVGEDDE